MRAALTVALVMGLASRLPAQWNEARVREAFREARALAEADAGTLWGRSLEGPLLVVNRTTREVLATQADGEGVLHEQDGLFRGTLPDEVNAANTALRWAGVHWTMLMAPLPEKQTDRVRLLAHELFHRVQEGLGLAAQSPTNGHLDQYPGRLWLRLEMRALVRALESAPDSDERALSAEDALTFRAYRRELCPDGAAEEDGLELNEGICEYTGLRLCGLATAAQVQHAAARLRGEGLSDTMTRSFAYATGPAYGLLLDEFDSDWRRTPAELVSLSGSLAETLGYLAPDALAEEADLLSEDYDGLRIREEEQQRGARREKARALHMTRYFEDPVLVLPLSSAMRYSFNPNRVEVLDGIGQVHRTLRVSDGWGVLEVDGGALLVRTDGRMVEVRVPAPADATANPLRGPGWSLSLNQAFALEDGDRPGDLTVRSLR